MKRLLCVIDLSESSRKVLEVAAKMAAACEARMTVLFPYRLIGCSDVSSDATTLKEKLEKQAVEKFVTLQNSIPGARGACVEFQPEIGFVTDRIAAHVRANNIEMIVVGQHQTDPKNEMGFSPEQLFRGAKLPLLIVPVEATPEPNLV